jgi:hypothetical protein
MDIATLASEITKMDARKRAGDGFLKNAGGEAFDFVKS